MYIDTHTKDTMQDSICKIFNIEVRELDELFIKAKKELSTRLFTDLAKLDSIFSEFIDTKMSNKNINQILFFHLGRRLNSAYNCVEGKNLFQLLSEKNEMSMFLKEHEITFKAKDGHLDLYYKDKFIPLEETEKTDISYLKWRLGHYSNRIDYCFNGFAFRDLLYKNRYTQSLYHAPEFIATLARFLGNCIIKEDYLRRSKYYCFEYLVPFHKIYFDDCEGLEETDKQKYFLNKVLHKLYGYFTTESIYMFDDDNSAIRLSDYDIMQREYFISRKEITLEMLR